MDRIDGVGRKRGPTDAGPLARSQQLSAQARGTRIRLLVSRSGAVGFKICWNPISGTQGHSRICLDSPAEAGLEPNSAEPLLKWAGVSIPSDSTPLFEASCRVSKTKP